MIHVILRDADLFCNNVTQLKVKTWRGWREKERKKKNK